ncbi:MAG: ABC transporter ATP-binding protein [Thermoplasmatota archaeon]
MTLQVKGVSRSFGRRQLFAPVDFALPTGERATLQGPNGSGKTTLLRIIAGQLNATIGTVDTPPFALVAQDAAVYPELTPLEHATFALAAHSSDADALACLQDAGIARLAHAPARVLSRGQRQRLHLAIAFASGADLLLLDEPFTGLDADGETWLQSRIAAYPGVILLAAHDPKHMHGASVQLERP